MNNFKYNDGGRAAAGYKGVTGDCATRSISIITGKPYKEVYDALNVLAKSEHIGKNKKARSNSRTGVYRITYEKYLKSIGYEWIPMTKKYLHLNPIELPSGRLVVRIEGHLTAVIDGVIHDNHDWSKEGKERIYGYFKKTIVD